MKLDPLTAAQQGAVDALVATGRITQVPVDLTRSGALLDQAAGALADVPNAQQIQNKYNLSYDAAHDVGEAMLAGYGYRTSHGPGAHEALAQFLGAVFDTPPANAAAAHVEQMRRERNAQRYRAVPPSRAAATTAESTARTLLHAATSRQH